MKKIKLGNVGVDSGQLMITDPCYIGKWESNQFQDIRKYKNKQGKILQYGKDFDNYEQIIPKYKTTMNKLISGGEWEKLPHPHAEDRSYSYRGSCMATTKSSSTGVSIAYGGELVNSLGVPLGVSFSSGYGDGCYEVYAYVKNIDGWGERVCKVEIILIEQNEEDL